MTTRNATPKKPPTIQSPRTPHEWKNLAALALEQARAAGDPRVGGLQRALETGQAEKHLRLMGIVCSTDINREFPTR